MLNSAIINLNNLRYNAKKIRQILDKDTKFCAVVKADAYGHGACEVASAIYDLVDLFAVALVEEGVELKRAGIKKDILVLIPPFKCDLERAVRFGLTLSVSDEKTIMLIDKEAKRQKKIIKVHLKVDTGMNRQGVKDLDEIDRLCAKISCCKNLELEGIFSHFANPQNKKSLNSALDKFLLANKVVKGYNNKVISHISASGGLLTGVQMDMVRVGIMLYGYTPFKTDKIHLKPVMKVVAPVIKTQTLKRGEVALYGDKRVKKTGSYSLIRYGYADGLERKNATFQHGNRCMDLTLVKSNGKNAHVILSDAEILAKEYKTITYEILCKAPIRAERKYRR